MSQPVPLRTITVSLNGNGTDAVDYYTFWSPYSGTSFTNSPACDITADAPVNTLFVLDYFTSLNGWTVTGISPMPEWPCLESVLGPLGSSIMTIDPHTTMQTYRYYINYTNSITGAQISCDPQQVNVPKLQPH
ncbi:hypothetical protein [Massilia sp. S19_KUP03_FR1]|uniref:hypothetical protein n=1 Tax=Massilia sp. S19_KUP03_FR1 TaxID=3025503 RepID=UPI002FCDE045